MFAVPTRASRIAALAALAALATPTAARAANPVLRHQADQRGDVVVFGSTLGFDCGAGVPVPPGATASCAGQTSVADGALDLYWLDDVANASILPTQARTSATLTLPPGSTVTYARLYWSALKTGSDPDLDATLDWLGGPQQTIVADDSWVVPYPFASHPDWFYYQATGDATDFVSTWGAGDFRVSDVDAIVLANVDVDRTFAAWTLVVFYENDGDELRNLALFDSFTPIDPGVPGQESASVTLDGFLVPQGFTARMATFGYEGDTIYSGDHFTVNGIQLGDAQSPADNVFNSSRANQGVPVSGTFDVPKLSGAAGSMAGYDLDTVDVTPLLSPGDTSAIVGADSTLDIFFLGGFVTSVTNLAPHFLVEKTWEDLNGGAVVTGDDIEFTITALNDGNDDAVFTEITDVIQAGMQFVPGSLQITMGGGNGFKSDPAGDDQAEYGNAAKQVTFRVGAGANTAVGGTVAPGESVSVKFKVTVTAPSGAKLANQALLMAEGSAGSPEKTWPSDGDPGQVGEQPTVIPVDECQSDAQCANPTPHCDLVTHICGPCASDADCTDPALPACLPSGACGECSETNTGACTGDTPTCDPVKGECVPCTPEDESACAGAPEGPQCVSSDGGQTVHCGCETDADCGDTASGLVCDPTTDACIPGCKGEAGNGCPTGEVCTSTDSTIGECQPGQPQNPGAEGECACTVPGRSAPVPHGGILVAVGALALAARRRALAARARG